MLTRAAKKRKLHTCGHYDHIWLNMIGEFIDDRKTLVALRLTMKLTSRVKGNCGFDTRIDQFGCANYANLCLPLLFWIRYPIESNVEDHFKQMFPMLAMATSKFKGFGQPFSSEAFITLICAIGNKILLQQKGSILSNMETIFVDTRFHSSSIFTYTFKSNRKTMAVRLFANPDQQVILNVFGPEILLISKHGVGSISSLVLKSNVTTLFVRGLCTLDDAGLERHCPNLEEIYHLCDEKSCKLNYVRRFPQEQEEAFRQDEEKWFQSNSLF